MEQKLLGTQAPRTALMRLLDNISKMRVIYIHAPAGFGKTTSSLLWLEHRAQAAKISKLWLSLDEYDNKTSEFCRRFVSALANLQPGNNALRELAAHPVFSTAPVEFTLHALGVFNENGGKYIFAFDDLHTIKNDEILKLLPVLLKRLPENCMVLFLSRSAPPDCLAEMVAKEEVAVVDAGYLQFTSGEIKAFFDKNGKYITSRQADEILASTGGWAIGIRALLLSDENSYSVNLKNQHLDNFLRTHVWEKWDDRLRNFMTLVSVAEELTAELCEWLVENEKTIKKSAAPEILAELVKENAFLRDNGNGTYRFHDLFREFLLKMLEQRGQEIMNRQWSRMGDYFFVKKNYFRTVGYYTKGNNDEGIAKSIHGMYDDHNSPYASVEETLQTVHLSLNDSIAEKYPFLLEPQAWVAFMEGRDKIFESLLDKYYKRLPKIILINPRSVVTSPLLRCLDYRESFVQMMKMLRRIPFKGHFKVATPTVTFNMPHFHRGGRDFSELSLDMDKNIALAEKSFGGIFGDEFVIIKECLYAGFQYERGCLDEAHEHALAACAKLPDGCSAEIKFCAMMILASVLYALGRDTEAGGILDNVKDMIEQTKTYYLNVNLRAFSARLELTEADKEAAKDWLKNKNGSVLDNLSFFQLYQHFTTARAYIVTGNYTNAVLFLQKLLDLCERYRRPLDIIEACILLSIVYWKKGKSGLNIALDYLEQAVLTAHEYGYTQLFANEGAELVNMLHRMQKRSVQKNYTGGKIPNAFVKTLYIAASAVSKRSKGLTDGSSSVNMVFTDKQKTVMRLMCEGYSRNEIAEKMGLKSNGVKSHTELIYKKLDVLSSLDAVLKIKELNLLEEK